MATDKSEPRTGVIIQGGVLAVVTIVAVRAVLVTYFDSVLQGEHARKVAMAKPESLMAARAAEQQQLTSGPVPIQKAMEDLARKGRGSMSPELMPSASHDMAPIQGWAKLPQEVPALFMATAKEATEVDAGAATSADGGGPAPAATGDAGAPKAGAADAGPSKPERGAPKK